VSRQAGQRTGQQAGRRETTKDTSGARECGWWMDGDLVWGWEIGSLETTRWRRDRSVPNVMLRACDWCDGAGALLEDARVCSNGHVTASIVQQCVSASLVIVLTAANRRERHCRRANSSIHTRRRAKTWSTSTTSTLPRSPQASGPRRMPRPPGTSCSHTRANSTPSRYRSDLHACRRAMSCWPRRLCRRIHMSLRCSSCARSVVVRH
jgi:phage gp46-like protein